MRWLLIVLCVGLVGACAREPTEPSPSEMRKVAPNLGVAAAHPLAQKLGPAPSSPATMANFTDEIEGITNRLLPGFTDQGAALAMRTILVRLGERTALRDQVGALSALVEARDILRREVTSPAETDAIEGTLTVIEREVRSSAGLR